MTTSIELVDRVVSVTEAGRMARRDRSHVNRMAREHRLTKCPGGVMLSELRRVYGAIVDEPITDQPSLRVRELVAAAEATPAPILSAMPATTFGEATSADERRAALRDQVNHEEVVERERWFRSQAAGKDGVIDNLATVIVSHRERESRLLDQIDRLTERVLEAECRRPSLLGWRLFG